MGGALSKVKLANKLGCEAQELTTKEMTCPKPRIGMVIGKNGAMITKIQETCKVLMDVNKLSDKVTITGSESSVQKAIDEVEKIIRMEELEVDLDKAVLHYLTSKYVKVTQEFRDEYPDVHLDADRKTGKLLIRGEPETVAEVKAKIGALKLSSKERHLVGKEQAIILGRKGATIDKICLKYAVSIEMDKGSEDSATAVITGPPSAVEEAMSEIEGLMDDNKEVTEIINVDMIVRNILVADGGRHIKALQAKVVEGLDGGNCYFSLSQARTAKDHPELLVKSKNSLISAACDLARAGLKDIDDLVVKVTVDAYVVPRIIGKGGETIKKLTEGKSAFVEVDRSTGELWYGATTVEGRDEVGKAVNELLESNMVLRVTGDPVTLNSQFREMNRSGLKKQLNDIDVRLDIDDEKSCYVLRGKKDVLEKAKTMIEEYNVKNQMAELPITDEDRDTLLVGGKECKLNLFAEEFNVKFFFDRANFVVTVRGTQENVGLAAKKLNQFLNGGDGHSVAKLPVTEQVVGVIIGKGGKTRQQLQNKYEGVAINISKTHVVTIRGPEQSVADCRVEIGKMIASARVTQTITVSEEEKETLAKKDFAKKIYQQTSVNLTLDGDKVVAKGSFYDVRDSVSLLHEMLTGEYKTAIELDAPQFAKVRNTVRDPSHFERMEAASGAKVQLDLAAGSVVVSGKRINVKKAKDQVYVFLDFVLPGELRRLKTIKPLYGSVGQASALAEISALAGGLVAYLDRDLSEVVLRSPDQEKVKLGAELVEAKIKEAERLAYVLEVSASESWILGAIVGKKGAQVSALVAKYPGCKVDVSKETRTISITGDSEDTVQSVREAILAAVEKARAENVFIVVPESYVPAFVGRGGVHVKELSAKHGVEIQRIQKGQFNFKLIGEAAKVETAKNDIDEWLINKEAANACSTFTLERESDVSVILGQKGVVARSISEGYSCRVVVDKKSLIVTVRGPCEEDREAAVEKMKELVANERVEAAARQAAAKENLELDVEPSTAMEGSNGVSECQTASEVRISKPDQDPRPVMDGSSKENAPGSEYPAQPVGITRTSNGGGKNKKKEKKVDATFENGTEAGRNLFAMLVADD